MTSAKSRICCSIKTQPLIIKMDLIICAFVVGSVFLYWYKTPVPDQRIVTKKKVIKIPLTPYRVAHKATQTDYSPLPSPMSSISSIDFTNLPFVLDEEYLEQGNESI